MSSDNKEGMEQALPKRNMEEVTFTNSKGESFHLSVFRPTRAATAEAPHPILLCVHGAGMSGDNFYNLAHFLQRQGRAAAANELPPISSQAAPHTAALPSTGMPPLPPSAGGARDRGPNGALPFGGAAHFNINSLMVANSDAEAEDIDMIVVTYDMRCHGLSTFAGGEEHLTLDVMVADFVEVLQFVLSEVCPTGEVFALGHSVGGSVVAHALADHKEATKARMSGVILVDVVEGTAKMSLHYMTDFLRKRPSHFATAKEAETWFLQHGGMRSPEGAAVSVPPLLTPTTVGGKPAYAWRTDLQKMEHVWGGWFDDLDKKFVSLPYSKMLCLANAERLDTELTVAQMQGKFQFEIIGNNCGHYIMDDATATIAAKVRRFVKRIVVLTRKLNAVNMKVEVTPGGGLHFNNATIPPSRMPK